MSPDRFPASIDPHRIFARFGSISSEIPLADFKRLSDCLSGASGTVKVHLEFGYDENERRLITGSLSTRVLLQCQRCLGDLPHDIETNLRVLVVSNEDQARILPQEVEVVVADESGLDLRALVEDELILSLPIVPSHENEACSGELKALGQTPKDDGGEGGPFAKLRELKRGKTE